MGVGGMTGGVTGGVGGGTFSAEATTGGGTLVSRPASCFKKLEATKANALVGV